MNELTTNTRLSDTELLNIREGLALARGPTLDGQTWGSAPYHPTPTNIEAARALYSRHSVEAISRSEAEGKNLTVTSVAVEEIIEAACAQREKAIIFVTGVPGAGKTLVGLNIATRHRQQGADRTVFLSGNGPLVEVLREALTRDELARSPRGTRKGTIKAKVKAFIQNVHHFTISSTTGTTRDRVGTWKTPLRSFRFRDWNLTGSA